MSCREFEVQVVSDDPVDQERAARHAAECDVCGPALAAHRRLFEKASAWRRELEAPAELEFRVRQALADAAAHRFRHEKRFWPRRALVPALMAASLLMALAIGWQLLAPPKGPETTQRLLAAEALEEARTAERRHARAIARLEGAAAPVLARAGDSATGPEEVGRLLAYADRLAFLDSTIEQVEAFIAENPTHPHSRITLLAAYREKTEILSKILTQETTS